MGVETIKAFIEKCKERGVEPKNGEVIREYGGAEAQARYEVKAQKWVETKLAERAARLAGGEQ